MSAFDRDDLIRIALTPDDAVRVPADLGDAIARSVADTRQRRVVVPGLALPRWLPGPSPTTALALVVGLLVVLGIAVVVASRPPAVPPSLTMYHGGPERSGVLPGPGPTGTPVVAWMADLHGRVLVTSMPLVADGRVYVADDGGYVSAFDAADGHTVWSMDLGSPIVGTPAIVDGLLVAGAVDGSLAAIDLQGQSVRWRASPGGAIRASLLVVGGSLFVGSDDGNVYVIDPEDGSTLMMYPIGGPVSRGPAYADGTLYVGADGGTFVALDVTSGRPRWSRRLGPGTVGTPAVVGGTVYVPFGLVDPSVERGVAALRTSDGTEQWSFSTASNDEQLAGAIGDDSVFVVGHDGMVRALVPETAAVRWQRDAGAPIGALAGLTGGVLYVTTDGQAVRAIDAATGLERWVIDVEGVPSMPAVIDGRVFVASSLGKLVALADPRLDVP